MSIFDDLRSEAMSIYRSKDFPVQLLIGCFIFGAITSQWVVLVGGFLGWIYFQFVKRDR